MRRDRAALPCGRARTSRLRRRAASSSRSSAASGGWSPLAPAQRRRLARSPRPRVPPSIASPANGGRAAAASCAPRDRRPASSASAAIIDGGTGEAARSPVLLRLNLLFCAAAAAAQRLRRRRPSVRRAARFDGGCVTGTWPQRLFTGGGLHGRRAAHQSASLGVRRHTGLGAGAGRREASTAPMAAERNRRLLTPRASRRPCALEVRAPWTHRAYWRSATSLPACEAAQHASTSASSDCARRSRSSTRRARTGRSPRPSCRSRPRRRVARRPPGRQMDEVVREAEPRLPAAAEHESTPQAGPRACWSGERGT